MKFKGNTAREQSFGTLQKRSEHKEVEGYTSNKDNSVTPPIINRRHVLGGLREMLQIKSGAI